MNSYWISYVEFEWAWFLVHAKSRRREAGVVVDDALHAFFERGRVNKADVERNETIQTLKQKCEVYISDLNKMGIRDWLINSNNNSKVN